MIRRLAAVIALALALAQGAAAVAAAAASASDALAGPTDCCVNGAHPVGQCPLHRKAQPSATCKLSCAPATAGPIVFSGGAIMPEPPAVVEAASVRTPFVSLDTPLVETSVTFETPPPRS